MRVWEDEVSWQNPDRLLKMMQDKVTSEGGITNKVKELARQVALYWHPKPQPCEVCGEPAERHHDDYMKPHIIRWLCKRCHENAHH